MSKQDLPVPNLYFQRLDVYRVAIEFVGLANDFANLFPKGHTQLRDQLLRAASSIALNIAEGAGESSGPDKARFYRMARRSATECGGAIDVAMQLGIGERELAARAQTLLTRIAQMLTRLVQRFAPWDSVPDTVPARVPGSEPEPEPVTGTGSRRADDG